MNDLGSWIGVIVLVLVGLFVVIALVRAVRIVPQAEAYVVERLGRYSRTLDAGLHLLVPFVDRVRAKVDLREQVVSFAPQPVITSDNLVVSIDTVIYFQVTSPRAAVYEIANYYVGIEQLTVTTLRNVIGTMDLEQTLTSRDQINGQLRGVLDEATGKWGIRVNRVELKAIDPPLSIQGSMEQQMRAERDRRATILTAEGVKQSKILTAEGEKQAQVLRAEGDAQATVLRAEGESRAILQVFDAVHRGDADPKLLAYLYLDMLPKIASGPSSTMWFLPAELSGALGQLSKAFGSPAPEPPASARPAGVSPVATGLPPVSLPSAAEALAEARRQSEAATAAATASGSASGLPFNPEYEVGLRPSGLPPQSPVPPTVPERAPEADEEP